MRMTAATVDRIRPTEKRQEIPDALCVGLYLVVQPTGRKGWQVRYRAAGVHRRMTLGAYPLLNLAAARDRARDVQRGAMDGGDPAAEVKARKAEVQAAMGDDRDNLNAVIASFLKRHASRNRRVEDVAAMFRREIVPKWGDRDIREITKRDVVDLLDAIVDRGSPISANRLLAHMRTLWTWAKGRDIIEGSVLDGIKPPAQERPRDRVLSDQEIRLFWQACDKLGQPFGALFQVLLLTGQRRGECANMIEREIKGNVWTIPAARVKNGDEHTVPLSNPVQVILGRLHRIKGRAGYLFTTTGEAPVQGFTRAKERLEGLMAEIARVDQVEGDEGTEVPPFTLHDLRRTAATGMAGLGFPPHVVEAVLNHRSGTRRGVAGVYNRFDYAEEKRAALEAWGRSVLSLLAA
ncbi:MAG: site-specific integrase [Albidovulum sp.]